MEENEDLKKSKSPFSKKSLNLLTRLKPSKKKNLTPEDRRKLLSDEELKQDLVYYLENEIPREVFKKSLTGKIKNVLPWLIPTTAFLTISYPTDGLVTHMRSKPDWDTFFFITLPIGAFVGTMLTIYGLGKKPLKLENVILDGLSTCTAIKFAQLLHDELPIWWAWAEFAIGPGYWEKYINLWTNPNESFWGLGTGHQIFLRQWLEFIPFLIGTYLVKKGIEYLKKVKKEEKLALAKLVTDKKISLDNLVNDFDGFKARDELIYQKRFYETVQILAESTKEKKAIKLAKDGFKKLNDCYRRVSKHIIKNHKPEIKKQREFWQEQDEQINNEEYDTFKKFFRNSGIKLYNTLCNDDKRKKDRYSFLLDVYKKLDCEYPLESVKLFVEDFCRGEEAKDCLSYLEPVILKD